MRSHLAAAGTTSEALMTTSARLSQLGNRMRLVGLAVVLGASACGGYENGTDTETISSAIYQGVNINSTELDNSGLVAIYHPKDPELPQLVPPALQRGHREQQRWPDDDSDRAALRDDRQ